MLMLEMLVIGPLPRQEDYGMIESAVAVKGE